MTMDFMTKVMGTFLCFKGFYYFQKAKVKCVQRWLITFIHIRKKDECYEVMKSIGSHDHRFYTSSHDKKFKLVCSTSEPKQS